MVIIFKTNVAQDIYLITATTFIFHK